MSLEQVIKLSIDEANRKIGEGKLFKSNDGSSESQDFENGDPETLYSLSSMYSQFIEDDDCDAEDIIYEALLNEFPMYE